MAISILMPALSPTMTEGTLAKWLVKAGDTIKSGMVIAEIETDKATMEVEAVEEGTIHEILIPAGTANVAVNTPIAIIREEGESEVKAPASPPAPAPNTAPAPAPTPAPTMAPAKSGEMADNTHQNRVFASPLAKRLAKEKGLDLSQLKGSGPHGRIVKHDIDHAPAVSTGPAKSNAPVASPAPTANAPVNPPTPTANPFEPAFDLVPLTTMRKVIAARLTESKQNIPHFYLSVDVEIDALMDFRARLNGKKDADYKISVNDIIIKALAMALKRVPNANASYCGNDIKIYKSIDIAVAVAIDGGLITPVVRAADSKGLASISNEMKNLAAKAKAGKLQPAEFQGGTISISNLGMFGIKNFQAVINPPQAAILAVGAGFATPIIKNGAVASATIMNLTLSVDHRAIDGAVGAELLKWVKSFLEDPETMFL